MFDLKQSVQGSGFRHIQDKRKQRLRNEPALVSIRTPSRAVLCVQILFKQHDF